MIIKLLIVCLFFSTACISQNITGQFPNVTFINKIQLSDSLNASKNGGCGFLITVNNEIYAATSKYVFSDSVNIKGSFDITNSIKSWEMYVGNDSMEKVVCNEDIVLAKNSDWLLSNVKSKTTSNKVLKWRESELVNGEPLYALGWSKQYLNSAQQTYIYTFIGKQGSHIQMRRIIAPENDATLWGAPVVDKEGLLVAIMAPQVIDKTKGELYSRACHVNVLIELFKNSEN